MGVCGSGKTTVGRALAERLQWRFLDADDFHPQANVAKMARGIPLTDDDRWPWFDRIVAEMKRHHAAGTHVVVACSALKQAYRDRLAQGGELRFAYLKGDAAGIEPRLAGRSGHFMPLVAAGEPIRHARGAVGGDRHRYRASRLRRRWPRSRAHCSSRFPHERRAGPGVEVAPGHGGRASRPRSEASTWARSIRPSIAPRRSCSTQWPISRRRNAANIRALPTACTACPPCATCRPPWRRSRADTRPWRFPRGSPRSRSRFWPPRGPGDHVLVTDSVYGPTRRFCEQQLKRFGVEVSYYDPLAGAAIEREFRPKHAPRVHRIARVALLRGAGPARHRRGRPPSRRAGGARQHLGYAAGVSRLCPRGRHLAARRHQVSGRPLRCAGRPGDLQRADLPPSCIGCGPTWA